MDQPKERLDRKFDGLKSAFQEFIKLVQNSENPQLWKLAVDPGQKPIYQITLGDQSNNSLAEFKQGLHLASFENYDPALPIEDCFGCATLALLYNDKTWEEEYVRVDSNSNHNLLSERERSLGQFWKTFEPGTKGEPTHVFMIDWDET